MGLVQPLRLLVVTALLGSAGAVALGDPQPACERPVPVFEAGRETGKVCPDDAAARGLTLVDLSDTWVPTLLRGQPYEATYVALANESPGKGHEFDRARQDRYLELYGIAPTVGVVVARLLDDHRHACHAATESAEIQTLTRSVRILDAVVSSSAPPEVVEAMDRRLTCDGLLPARKFEPVPGVPGMVAPAPRPRWRIEGALLAYQRKHAVVSRGVIDSETRATFAADSRELDLRALLRVLRTRVIDATGIIEDGTALAARGTVLGRRIEGGAFYQGSTQPHPAGVPDLTSINTEVAALALGWTSPAAAQAFFRARGPEATRSLVVAMRLPPPPAYHSAHMDLRVEIDKGDVWYDVPGKIGRVGTAPRLTIFAKTPSGAEVALVRWPTTIGGWKREQTDTGYVGLRFKDSDVGPRIWKDLVTTPTWNPPPGTPTRTLVRQVERGKWIADTDLTGPGYASAYGLVMLIHHQPYTVKGHEYYADNGIRTHGTVSYASILHGESHGCHRLFNQSAVQLGSFILRHRHHETRGIVDRPFVKMLSWQGRRLPLTVPHRGYLFELTPPIAVNVLEGNIHGRFHKPPGQLVRLPPKPRMPQKKS